MVAAMLACLGLVTSTDLVSQQNVGQIYLGPAKDNGDEILSFTYKDGPTAPKKTVELQTGQTGTANIGDDITKGTTAAQKAEKLVAAINAKAAEIAGAGNPLPFQATAAGHTISLVTNAPNHSLDNLRLTNNTNQKRDKVKISKDPAALAMAAPPSPPERVTVQVAHVIFIGGLQGTNDDGLPAEVRLGTDRHEVVAQTSAFDSLEAMCAFLVRALVSNGVAASLVLPTVVRIDLDETDDGVVYGCDDTSVHHSASIELK